MKVQFVHEAGGKLTCRDEKNRAVTFDYKSGELLCWTEENTELAERVQQQHRPLLFPQSTLKAARYNVTRFRNDEHMYFFWRNVYNAAKKACGAAA